MTTEKRYAIVHAEGGARQDHSGEVGLSYEEAQVEVSHLRDDSRLQPGPLDGFEIVPLEEVQ